MLKESVRVVAVGQDSLWVEARGKRQCRACSAQNACGHALLEKFHPVAAANRLRLPLEEGQQQLRAGDEVILAVPESLVLRLSLLFYLLPLAGLLAGSLAAGLAGAEEFLTILAGLGGLAMAFVLARHLAAMGMARGEFQARVAEPASLSLSPSLPQES